MITYTGEPAIDIKDIIMREQQTRIEELEALCDRLGEALEKIAWLTVSGTKGNNLANAALAAWREMKGNK